MPTFQTLKMASLGRLSRAVLRAPLAQARQLSAAAGAHGAHEGGGCTMANAIVCYANQIFVIFN